VEIALWDYRAPRMAEYRILAEGSEVLVSATSSVHPIDGAAGGVSGDVDVEAADGHVRELRKGRIEVPIDELRSGNKLYDVELQRRVDSRRYPVIVGEIRTASAVNDDGLFDVEGDVTFHGVTQPVSGSLAVHVDNGGRLVVKGEHVFDIREFGIKPPKILMLRVHPEVTVRIRLVAELGAFST